MKKILVVVLLLTGCGDVHMHSGRSVMPRLDIPKRPVLQELAPEELAFYQKVKLEVLKPKPEDPKLAKEHETYQLIYGFFLKIQNNTDALRLYCMQIESTIQVYNDWSDRVSATVNQELGTSKAKPEGPK